MSCCRLVLFSFPLQGELDRERFSTDLKRIVEMDTGYKAELRIFVSKGDHFVCVCVCMIICVSVL